MDDITLLDETVFWLILILFIKFAAVSNEKLVAKNRFVVVKPPLTYNHTLYCYFSCIGFALVTLLYLCLMTVRVKFYYWGRVAITGKTSIKNCLHCYFSPLFALTLCSTKKLVCVIWTMITLTIATLYEQPLCFILLFIIYSEDVYYEKITDHYCDGCFIVGTHPDRLY